MIRSAIASVTFAAVLFAAAPARSHHSNVAFEVTKIITITGVVKEFQWVNPHTFVYVMADDGKGGRVEWVAEVALLACCAALAGRPVLLKRARPSRLI